MRNLARVPCGVAVVLAALAASTSAALALPAEREILSGGVSISIPLSAPVVYTAPGTIWDFSPNTFAAGAGEAAAQIRMPSGKISALNVKAVFDGNPTGTLTLAIRLAAAPNATPTAVTSCTISAFAAVGGGKFGVCSAPPAKVPAGSWLSVEVSHALTGASLGAVSYSMQFD